MRRPLGRWRAGGDVGVLWVGATVRWVNMHRCGKARRIGTGCDGWPPDIGVIGSGQLACGNCGFDRDSTSPSMSIVIQSHQDWTLVNRSWRCSSFGSFPEKRRAHVELAISHAPTVEFSQNTVGYLKRPIVELLEGCRGSGCRWCWFGVGVVDFEPPQPHSQVLGGEVVA